MDRKAQKGNRGSGAQVTMPDPASTVDGNITAVLFFQSRPPSRTAVRLVEEACRRARAVFGSVPLYTNRPVDSVTDLKTLAGIDLENVSACLGAVLESSAREDQDSVALFHDFAPHFDAKVFADLRA